MAKHSMRGFYALGALGGGAAGAHDDDREKGQHVQVIECSHAFPLVLCACAGRAGGRTGRHRGGRGRVRLTGTAPGGKARTHGCVRCSRGL